MAPRDGSSGSTSVVLLSGGLDSAACAAIDLAQGRRVVALSFDYGQRHAVELDAARRIASALGIADHRVLRLDLRAIGGSALTADIDVPKHRSNAEIESGIPVTYVPARNLVFLSLAVGLAEAVHADAVTIGVNQLDYSGYPDCRGEFIEAFQSAARLATKVGVEGSPIAVRTPLIELTKAQIIKRGHELGVPFELTSSCYDPTPSPDGPRACGSCDSCLLRRKGFEHAGIADPTLYA